MARMVLAILLASAVAASTISPPVESWANDPAVEMRDAYKWIFQAAMGGEHAAPSRDAADRWLRQEWQTLGPTAPDEPLLEPLGDSGIVRLHLRPFRDAGGVPDALLDAFLASAASSVPVMRLARIAKLVEDTALSVKAAVFAEDPRKDASGRRNLVDRQLLVRRVLTGPR